MRLTKRALKLVLVETNESGCGTLFVMRIKCVRLFIIFDKRRAESCATISKNTYSYTSKHRTYIVIEALTLTLYTLKQIRSVENSFLF